MHPPPHPNIDLVFLLFLGMLDKKEVTLTVLIQFIILDFWVMIYFGESLNKGERQYSNIILSYSDN